MNNPRYKKSIPWQASGPATPRLSFLTLIFHFSFFIFHSLPLPASAQIHPVSNQPPEDRVDEAIERGLAFIARGQLENGKFDSQLASECPGVTGLCGMAFLAKGYLPGEGVYGTVLTRCVDAILKEANATGYMGKGRNHMYSHSIATLFLCEVSGMVTPELQKRIDIVLPKATKILLDAQAVKKDNNHRGGWRYTQKSTDSDLSCSGWALMALRSARLNGAPVPPSAIEEAVQYILRRHNTKTGTFGYQNTEQHANTLSGMAILCLALCGQHDNPAIPRGVRYLMTVYTQLPQQKNRCFYGMYYTAQGLFQYGGQEWQRFADWMYDYWIPRQKPDGSWNRNEENDLYYQTAMVILAFTVPYRQLPIYQRDETVDLEE